MSWITSSCNHIIKPKDASLAVWALFNSWHPGKAIKRQEYIFRCISSFLDASSHLYKRVCLSVGPSQFHDSQWKSTFFNKSKQSKACHESHHHAITSSNQRTHRWPYGPCFYLFFTAIYRCPFLKRYSSPRGCWCALEPRRAWRETRPIRPTMRPHDDGMIAWWRDYMRFFLTSSSFDLLKLIYTEAWQTDRWTYRPTDG